ARGELLIEGFHEVDARLDGIDVHEQLLAVEMLQQSVVEAACRRLVVAAPVTDKDATGHNILGVCSIRHVARENSNGSIRAQQRPHGDRYHARPQGARRRLTASKWLL